MTGAIIIRFRSARKEILRELARHRARERAGGGRDQRIRLPEPTRSDIPLS
jgi:hypothetical protein